MIPHWFTDGSEARRRTARYYENGRLQEQVDEWVRKGQSTSDLDNWLLESKAEEKKGDERFRFGVIRTTITASTIHGSVGWAAFYTLAFAPHWSLVFIVYAAATWTMGWIWLFAHAVVWVVGIPLLAFDRPISVVVALLAAAWIGPGKWAYVDE